MAWKWITHRFSHPTELTPESTVLGASVREWERAFTGGFHHTLADLRTKEAAYLNNQSGVTHNMAGTPQGCSMIPDRLTQAPPLLHAWVDGACKGNPGPGGWGALAKSITGETLLEAFGGEPSTTNNKMELQAAIEILTRVPVFTTLEITTDSDYVRKGITEWIAGWKRKNWRKADGTPVKNAEQWQQLLALTHSRKVIWKWVKGHSGDPGNDRADALANMGVPGRK